MRGKEKKKEGKREDDAVSIKIYVRRDLRAFCLFRQMLAPFGKIGQFGIEKVYILFPSSIFTARCVSFVMQRRILVNLDVHECSA